MWQPENLSYNGKDIKIYESQAGVHYAEDMALKENENRDGWDNLCTEFLDKLESLRLFQDWLLRQVL